MPFLVVLKKYHWIALSLAVLVLLWIWKSEHDALQSELFQEKQLKQQLDLSRTQSNQARLQFEVSEKHNEIAIRVYQTQIAALEKDIAGVNQKLAGVQQQLLTREAAVRNSPIDQVALQTADELGKPAAHDSDNEILPLDSARENLDKLYERDGLEQTVALQKQEITDRTGLQARTADEVTSRSSELASCKTALTSQGGVVGAQASQIKLLGKELSTRKKLGFIHTMVAALVGIGVAALLKK